MVEEASVPPSDFESQKVMATFDDLTRVFDISDANECI
ncbi:hypothetical protein HMPREF9176_1934 [Streptococcus downei F0415]|nr:hypothetical protein HMPREF9176_1934 [Streptococcus downei F0415]